jgi:iron complex transport system permease protein
MARPNKLLRAYVLGLGLWALAFILALRYGTVSDLDSRIVMELRLPRALLASAVGLGLAVSGATLQALFTNPLCEPYTLGISSGAALGAVLGATLGFNFVLGGLLGSAFLGALVFAGVLYLISTRRGVNNLGLLLAGVMLGFLGSSLVALWMAVSDANGIQSAILWLMGDLSRARLHGAIVSLAMALVLSFTIWTSWRSLDALMMGEEGAASLGVAVPQARRHLILMSSLLIGLCVSGSGMIGFVGLVVPHFARRFAGSLHLKLLPLCAILGAATLTFADVLARVIAKPYELPVGVVTALIGAPLFLWIMIQRRSTSS